MEKSLADFVNAALEYVEEISSEDAKAILEAQDQHGWYFIDVRETDEFAEGHIPGARSYPRGFLEVRADRVHHKRDSWLEDRDRRLLLYCGGGNRSVLAARTLQEMGFSSVRSLREGWTGWIQRDFPTER